MDLDRIIKNGLLVAGMVLWIFSPIGSALAGTDLHGQYRMLKEYSAQADEGKISYRIKELIDAMKAHGITRQNAGSMGASRFSNPLVRVSEDGFIQVYIHLSPDGKLEEEAIEGYEGVIELVDEDLRIVQAWVPFDRMEGMADLSFIGRVVFPSYGFPATGSVTTQGDSLLRTDLVRASGFDGSGVRMGVISDGVNNHALSRATGDLPARITIVNRAGSGDEGTAMLEIVHDLAPGAELGFCGGQVSSLEMINCINGLMEGFGAQVIVDDLIFYLEPYFEDGLIAQTVSRALDRGTVYIAPAGNDGLQHHEGQFRQTFFPGFTASVHDFGSASQSQQDPTMNVMLLPGATTNIILQWNDPFLDSGNDYDLLLLNNAETAILASSTGVQDGDDNPLEFLTFTNATQVPVILKVVIVKASGIDRYLEVFLAGGPLQQVLEYNVPEGNIFGHGAVPGVVTAASVAANDPGNDDIEIFSSRGPALIFFPLPEMRMKPAVASIDGIFVTGAGGFPSPFFGTSAAAAHAAGVAALLRQISPFPEQVIRAMLDSAVDLGPPGPDNISGAGRIDAVAAVEALR